MASVSFVISVYAMYMIRWSKFLLFIYSIALCSFFFLFSGGGVEGLVSVAYSQYISLVSCSNGFQVYYGAMFLKGIH